MTDTPETQPVEGAEILKLLRTIEAQGRANGEALTETLLMLTALSTNDAQQNASLATLATEAKSTALAIRNSHKLLTEVAAVVREAAPLLQSRAAKALRGGGVLAYLKGDKQGG